MNRKQKNAIIDNYRVMRDVRYMSKKIAQALELSHEDVLAYLEQYVFIDEPKQKAKKCYIDALNRCELYSAQAIKKAFNL